MNQKKGSILLMIIASVGYLLFCSAIPSALAMFLEGILDRHVNETYAVFSFVAGILFTLWLYKKNGEKIEFLKNVSVKGLLAALVIGLTLFVVINFVVSPFLGTIFTASEVNYGEKVAQMYETPAATFFQVVLIAPLFEELVFRGFMLKRELRYRSTLIAVFFVALLFGVLHMSIVQGISAFAAGIILCMFYAKTRSVGLTFVAHSFYNGLAYLLMLMFGGF